MAQDEITLERENDRKWREYYLKYADAALKHKLSMTAKYSLLGASYHRDRLEKHNYQEEEALRRKYPHIDFSIPSPQPNQSDFAVK